MGWLEEYRDLFGFGGLFRSAEMEYVTLQVQDHAAPDVVRKLGAMGAVQFTDLNGDVTAFKRFYTPLVRRCDELEKKLRFFDAELARAGVVPAAVTPEAFDTWRATQLAAVHRDHAGLGLLDYWEAVIAERHRDFVATKAEREKAAAVLYSAAQRRGETDALVFRHIAGILPYEDKTRFARIVFRASLGHAAVRFSDIPGELMDASGDSARKSVFAVFFRGRALVPKLERICAAFGAHTHDIPDFARPADVAAALNEAKGAIKETVSWMRAERAASATSLAHLSLLVSKWRVGVQREKAVFHTLNCFERHPTRGSVSAAGWVIKSRVSDVAEAIRGVHSAAAGGARMSPYFFEVVPAVGGSTPHPSTPPTFFATNKFTKVFQGIVDTYGVPRYREANPAIFSIVTFPFLFGVMFGDMGHATVLALAAGWMVWQEEALMRGNIGEIFSMAFGGRYMLLCMGLFSIYCGGIYNDLFSLGTTGFTSVWSYPITAAGTKADTAVRAPGDVYPFGVDPEWHNSTTDLLFFNSLKMKMSVILGIIQMTFGISLKVSNAIHFKSPLDLWGEALPQLLFMVTLFGYMIFIILLKWSIDWSNPLESPGSPPSLIDTLINIALKPGTISDPLYAGQGGVQVFVLLIAFACVPIMLFTKPYLMSRKPAGKGVDGHGSAASAAASEAEGRNLLAAAAAAGVNTSGALVGISTPPADTAKESAVAEHGSGGGHGSGHDHHSFGELFIHQAIETIEFVLGSVSNTASYLRLWALSLAHSQLATVFWERALVASIETDSTILVFVGFAVFAGISIAVLLVMDVLECFLHALRLHWVEFQNKFYKADGHKFTPLSFAALAAVAAGQD